MASRDLERVALTLVADGKGILAADETVPTLTRRFDTLGIKSTEQSRRTYREMLFTSPGAAEFISGVIMYDETIRQKSLAEALAVQGVVPGIKVDTGAKPLAGSPDETVTEGLDGLRNRLSEYRSMGARFAKWRAVIRITDALPTSACVSANAHALARYAALIRSRSSYRSSSRKCLWMARIRSGVPRKSLASFSTPSSMLCSRRLSHYHGRVLLDLHPHGASGRAADAQRRYSFYDDVLWQPMVVKNYKIIGVAKAAPESAVRYMAAELGPKGIRVHAISPGPLATRAASGIPEFDELLDKAKAKAPSRSLVSIDDVGIATAFLAHDAARLITGETLYIDGGYHIID